MEGQTQTRPMALAFGAVAAVAACVVLGAASAAPSTSLYTSTASGVSVVRPSTVVSRSAAAAPHMGRPAMAAMPTSEVDAAVPTPVAQVNAAESLDCVHLFPLLPHVAFFLAVPMVTCLRLCD